MTETILKLGLRIALFVTSRHRLFGIRDWIASLVFIAIISVFSCVLGSLWILGVTFSSVFGSQNIYFIIILFVIFNLVIASAPVAFILKIRRNGITDADYSVVTGIDYKSALESSHGGFDFMGVGAAKLRAQEEELREAVRTASRDGKKVRMLLIDPEASTIFERLQNMDGSTAYQETVQGSMIFLQRLQKSNPECVEIRLYKPTSIEDVKPLRMFFSGQDCLVSPFSSSTGGKDQGRGLPQLRITEVGFPKKSDVTLFRALKRNFEINWMEKR